VTDKSIVDICKLNFERYYPGCYDAHGGWFATLEQIKRGTFATLQVIFLSAKNKEKDIEKRLSLGANLYVVKPFRSKVSRTST
jgi:response regulator of citrate/malate metabolism